MRRKVLSIDIEVDPNDPGTLAGLFNPDCGAICFKASKVIFASLSEENVTVDPPKPDKQELGVIGREWYYPQADDVSVLG